jgi:hypothetical protein
VTGEQVNQKREEPPLGAPAWFVGSVVGAVPKDHYCHMPGSRARVMGSAGHDVGV